MPFNKPKEGKSTIYVYRKSNPITQGYKRSLWIDNKCIGSTANNSFFKVDVDTGVEYELSTQSEASPNSIDVKFDSDDNYYYEQIFTLGWAVPASKLEPREREVAEADIMLLRLGVNGECEVK